MATVCLALFVFLTISKLSVGVALMSATRKTGVR